MNVDIRDIENMKVKDKIARMKYVKDKDIDEIDRIKEDIDKELSSMTEE
jgi:hypothetical protein